MPVATVLDVSIISIILIGFFLIPIFQCTAWSVFVNKRKCRKDPAWRTIYGAKLEKSDRGKLDSQNADKRLSDNRQDWVVKKW